MLNITWLQDANYAKTSGYDSDGQMEWNVAVAWADGLVYGGYSDWRLPTVNPINGIKLNHTHSIDGHTDFGYNISAPGTMYAGSTASELAYMHYQNLNNPGYYNASGTGNGCFVSDPSDTCLLYTSRCV